MRKSYAGVGAFLFAAFSAQSVSAQTAPVLTGAELEGHSVRVDFGNGTVNTVHFDPGGVVRIAPASGPEVQGRWLVQGQSLCLQNGLGTRECWTYRSAFQAGQPVSMTSDCAGASLWTAMSTNPPPPPEIQQSGERG